MDTLRPIYHTKRSLVAILIGVLTAILLAATIRKNALGTVMRTLIALSIARLTEPKELAALGFVVGGMTGIYLGVRLYLGQGELLAVTDFLKLGGYLLGGFTLTGLLCASYGYLRGKVLHLNRKGQGPFF